MTAPLPILALHHIARATNFPEESIAFYRDVLGFRSIKRPPFKFRGAWLYNYGVQIHIIENPDGAPKPSEKIDSRADHVAFAVEDVAPIMESLKQRGIPFRDQVNAGNIHQVFFQDPDGHHIEVAFYGPTPEEIDA